MEESLQTTPISYIGESPQASDAMHSLVNGDNSGMKDGMQSTGK